jgi:hypothetical protein
MVDAGQYGAFVSLRIPSCSSLMTIMYMRDGSESIEGGSGRVTGESMNRLVDTADLNQIVHVHAADADPNAITIVIKPSKLTRSHNWCLLLRDRQGAEKLVEDVRKAIFLGAL